MTILEQPDAILKMRVALLTRRCAREQLYTPRAILHDSTVLNGLAVTIRKKGCADPLATGKFTGNGRMDLDWGTVPVVAVTASMMVIDITACSVLNLALLVRVR